MKYFYLAAMTMLMAAHAGVNAYAQGSGTTVTPTPSCEKGYRYDRTSGTCVPVRPR